MSSLPVIHTGVENTFNNAKNLWNVDNRIKFMLKSRITIYCTASLIKWLLKCLGLREQWIKKSRHVVHYSTGLSPKWMNGSLESHSVTALGALGLNAPLCHHNDCYQKGGRKKWRVQQESWSWKYVIQCILDSMTFSNFKYTDQLSYYRVWFKNIGDH